MRPGLPPSLLRRRRDSFVPPTLLTWTESSSSSNDYIYSGAYAPSLGRHVRVGETTDSEPLVQYSDNNGATWSVAATPPVIEDEVFAFKTIWDGTRFLALFTGGGANLYESPTGDVWSEIALPTGVWITFAYSPDLDQLLIAGDHCLATSGNGGTSWDARTAPSFFYLCAEWVPAWGKWLIAGKSNALVTSANGVTWGVVASRPPLPTVEWGYCAAASGSDLYPSRVVLTGIKYSTNGYTCYSDDGVTFSWSDPFSAPYNPMIFLLWNPVRKAWVAVTSAGIDPENNTAWSLDGITWTLVNSGDGETYSESYYISCNTSTGVMLSYDNHNYDNDCTQLTGVLT